MLTKASLNNHASDPIAVFGLPAARASIPPDTDRLLCVHIGKEALLAHLMEATRQVPKPGDSATAEVKGHA